MLLALCLLLLAEVPDLVGSELAGTNTGIVGYGPSFDGNVIAFPTDEMQARVDLNGDGVVATGEVYSKGVIRYYDMRTRTLTNTGAEGRGPSVDGNMIAFSTSESEDWGAGVDLNMDGDKNDTVIRYYDLRTGRVTNTRAAGSNPSLDGDIIAFETPEISVGVDLNGDGDTLDGVIRYYDITTGTLTNTGVVGSSPCLLGGIIAFSTSENEEGVDLNGDEDVDDYVIRYYDLNTGQVTNTRIAGDVYSFDSKVIAFSTYEGYVDVDLNDDGDTQDSVIGYYDISTGLATNTKIVGNPLSLDGNRIAFDRWVQEYTWFETGYYDISTGEVTIISVGSSPSLRGDTIAFDVWERWVETDLNDDGDRLDLVIWYYVIGVDEPAEWPTGVAERNLVLIGVAGTIVAVVLLVIYRSWHK